MRYYVITLLLAVLVGFGLLWAYGRKPAPAGTQNLPLPADVAVPGSETAEPLAVVTEPQGLHPSISAAAPVKSTEKAAVSTRPSAPDAGTSQASPLEMVLKRDEWTKETPYLSRKFTLVLNNSSNQALQLDRKLLQPSRMTWLARPDGSVIEAGHVFAPAKRNRSSDNGPLTLEPGKTETIAFTLADVASNPILDALSYSLQCSYDGSTAAAKSSWTGKAQSNKLTVGALGDIIAKDYQGRITRNVSQASDARFFYDSTGRLTSQTSQRP
jgi:hypothetical protein